MTRTLITGTRLRDLRGQRPQRDAIAIPDYVRCSKQVNVVTTSTTRLINPHAYQPTEWRANWPPQPSRARCRCTRQGSSRASPPTTYP
jgi:hypothetical protein